LLGGVDKKRGEVEEGRRGGGEEYDVV